MTSPQVLLKDWNLYPIKQLGQNFLKDPSTAAMIVSRAHLTDRDIVLEIGAGLGALTLALAVQVQKVFAIEKDRRLLPILQSEVFRLGSGNVSILNGDILDIDINTIAQDANQPIIVVGNLPYNISSQILARLVLSRPSVIRAVFMLQKELVDRLTAPPGNRRYGRLSVVLQYCATVRKIAEVSAPLFFPKPKVDSEVIEVRFKEIDRPADSEPFFFQVVKAAFSKRRKVLKNALGTSELRIDPKTATELLKTADIDPSRRAETLSIAEFVRLSNVIHEKVGD